MDVDVNLNTEQSVIIHSISYTPQFYLHGALSILRTIVSIYRLPSDSLAFGLSRPGNGLR